jgi:probable F420-dependent oxidoreductase
MKFTVAVSMCPAPQILPVAVAAEHNGWYGVTLGESVFFPEKVDAKYPYTADGSRFWGPETPFVDPWVAIPAMAAVTERLFFHTSVIKLPIRSPLLVAKTVGSAAALSGDRVGLGVGLSWIPQEFRWCGTSWEDRGPRTDEMIEILRKLLAGPGMVEHHGRFYDFDRLQMSPAPGRPVPIYVGGHGAAGLRRAARLGDGWISANKPAAELVPTLARLRELRREAGREREPFEIMVIATDVFDVAGYRRLEEQGVTQAIVVPWYLFGGDPERVETKRDAIARFADRVIAHFA